jgi:hypothetical protein
MTQNYTIVSFEKLISGEANNLFEKNIIQSTLKS